MFKITTQVLSREIRYILRLENVFTLYRALYLFQTTTLSFFYRIANITWFPSKITTFSDNL